MINVSIKPICDGVVNGNALYINNCLIWFDFGIENESEFDKLALYDLELPHLILLTNFHKTSIGGLPILYQILHEKAREDKGTVPRIPIMCTEPIFRFGNNILSDIIQSMNIKDQERGIQYTCNKDNDGFKLLPFTNEDIEGIFGENVCRLRYYQCFNIQLLHSDSIESRNISDKQQNKDDEDTQDSILTSIVLKALPSGCDLGSTIWIMTINSTSGSWEFAYVNETVAHPYWHVTPSDIGRLNRPDILMLGINSRLCRPQNISCSDSKPEIFTNRLSSIKRFINTILDCFKRNKNGTILVPIQLDSLLLELLCYIDAIWNKGKILYPVFVTSPLIKSFLLSVKTLIEWMSLDIRSEFCNSRFNPFHDLKSIYLETNLKNIRNDTISKIPKVIFAFPESLDYGYSRELFTELSSNENNTVLFIREPRENTFAHTIWSKEIELKRCNDISQIYHYVDQNMNNNILGDNDDNSYYIELPMIKFSPYRQDELYAMYLSHKESNNESNNTNIEDTKTKNIEMNDHKNSDLSLNKETIPENSDSMDVEMNIEEDSRFLEIKDSKINSNEVKSKNDSRLSIKDNFDYINNQSIKSSIQTKIENLRSKLVPINIDDELLNINSNLSSSLTSTNSSSSIALANNETSRNINNKSNKDDYGCLLDEDTLHSIITSWKDASSDVDITSYNLNFEDNMNHKPSNEIKNRSNIDCSDQISQGKYVNNIIQILAPKRRRNLMDVDITKDDSLLDIKDKNTVVETSKKIDSILVRNSKSGSGLVSMTSIDSNSAVVTTNLPEWRVHLRQILGGTEPYRITYEKSKIEVRCRVILCNGLELENDMSSLLPLINVSNPKVMVLLSNYKDNKEERKLNYYKSLLMSLPNSPSNIISSRIEDHRIIEFSLEKNMKSIQLDHSVWDDIFTSGFQLVQNTSSPSAALLESKNIRDSVSSYCAFTRIDNISAKLLDNGEVIFIKTNKNKNDEDRREDLQVTAHKKNELIDHKNENNLKSELDITSDNLEEKDSIDQSNVNNKNSQPKNYQNPYFVLKNLIKKVKYNNFQPKRKHNKEILFSKSRGLRHIISEMRKQNPLPIISISPNGGIISVNNAVAFSSSYLNKDIIQDSQINGKIQNEDSLKDKVSLFKLRKGVHLKNCSNTDNINVWNLHAKLHPYYYIARSILRNQFAIL